MQLKDYALGLQHIGLPTNDMEKTVEFYKGLGFDNVYSTVNEGAGEKVVFLRLKNLTIEAYENGKAALRDGAIDHIAIDVSDVEAVFRFCKSQGFTILSNDIEELPFWEKGVRFFIIQGPNSERIEFNQFVK